jgi:hypothetical protein
VSIALLGEDRLIVMQEVFKDFSIWYLEGAKDHQFKAELQWLQQELEVVKWEGLEDVLT